jgi:hypothetical protein
MTDEQQARAAALFGTVARQLMQAAADFAKGVAGHLSAFDVARLYVGTGIWLAAQVAGRTEAVAMLRSLADQLESGDDLRTLN